MDQVEHVYKNTDFEYMMKAQFRKYLDKIYFKKNLVVDVVRKVEGAKLVIYKVHKASILFKDYFFVEQIIIDRKEKLYKSFINTFSYIEECYMQQKENNIHYIQKFSVPFFMKEKKKLTFNKGCEIVEKIIEDLKYAVNRL